ncbi:universal stress protein [Marinivivus vitaminiproducens]|uniref:universal stress protein n=1 Tax=Marinivivus vitaminiproducens TaxID=3035935 RepID=UPI0027988294|nr:universal stress protein [Geminicoccaceae bacterium SCSIO 64248]
MSRILACIDGSIYGQSVCDHAAWASERLEAEVEVTHVLGRRDLSSVPADLTGSLDATGQEVLMAELVALDAQRSRLAQRRGELALEEARRRLEGRGVTAIKLSLRSGDLTETVNEADPPPDVVVIGKRGEGADFAKMHLGSNLERVVRAGHRPILVASRAFKPIRRVLVAHDGGESARKAVDYMATSPLFAGLEIHLVHAGADRREVSDALGEAHALLSTAGRSASTAVIEGEPDHVIATYVRNEDIDLLVMGAYGHSRIRALLVGSVTTEMVRTCLIPVMLFR